MSDSSRSIAIQEANLAAPEALEGLGDRIGENALVQRLGNRFENDVIEALLPDQERVSTHGRPALMVAVAAVEGPSRALEVSSNTDQRPATGCALGNAA
jgi:hypothetical protein